MSFIDNNDDQPNQTNDDFLNAIISIHSKDSSNYGFNFDTQIGGLKQINSLSKNWKEFYIDKRLYYIFDLVNIQGVVIGMLFDWVVGMLSTSAVSCGLCLFLAQTEVYCIM